MPATIMEAGTSELIQGFYAGITIKMFFRTWSMENND